MPPQQGQWPPRPVTARRHTAAPHALAVPDSIRPALQRCAGRGRLGAELTQ